MKYTRSFNGTGEHMGGACFTVKGADGESTSVFRSVLWVDVTLGEGDAAAYRARYNPHLQVQASTYWFDMKWLGDEGPQLRLIISPDVVMMTQDTVEARHLAERAVHHLGRLLRGEV